MVLIDEIPLGATVGENTKLEVGFPIFAATEDGKMSDVMVNNGWNITNPTNIVKVEQVTGESWANFQTKVESTTAPAYGLFVNPADTKAKLVFNLGDLYGTFTSPKNLTQVHALIDADTNLSAVQKQHTKDAYTRVFANSNNTGVLAVSLQIRDLEVENVTRDYENNATLKWHNGSVTDSAIIHVQATEGGATTGEPQSVTIKKLQKDTDKALSGAKFKLQKLNSLGVFEDYVPVDGIKEKTTNATGIAEFKQLSVGSYKVVEVEAPVGYTADV